MTGLYLITRSDIFRIPLTEEEDLNIEKLGDYGLVIKKKVTKRKRNKIRKAAHARAANHSNRPASNFGSTQGHSDPIQTPQIPRTSISTQTITPKNNMKDVEAQTVITTSEASTTIEQAKAVAELEAMAEIETLIQDKED
ncbi:hypothetical protein CHS0354_036465 [Potamilus streckersoni]|uniref:Uncharacterized protein n=1 Tax=Potamilus streckersoni TaxID=2493646 RepID=A0AAE0SX63_9BIVA|nr:hypothetical protein CHS0354_036465 [Potamilus streckersoni]